ncbi:hypothetical protein [Streptomyces sp. NPDC101115]|uniref:hypothetical protein n=1 Tax=Streptomyces sp. NPDC101115 TaxID=3366106 RepID=UPI003812E8A8
MSNEPVRIKYLTRHEDGTVVLRYIGPGRLSARQKSQLLQEFRSSVGAGELTGWDPAPALVHLAQVPPRLTRQQPKRRGRRAIDLVARLLPRGSSERWQEEWSAEWQDMAGASRRARWTFLARLLLRTGPTLAWVLRVQQRKEAA